MLLAQLSTDFQSLFPLPTNKLGPFCGGSQVRGFVYILGAQGFLQWTLLWGWDFLLLLQPTQVFTPRGLEALVSHAGTLGCMVCLTPQLFLPAYLHRNGDCLVCQLQPRPPSLLPSAHPLCPSCPSPPLLLVWMNVSSLTPWLWDFYFLTVLVIICF